MELILRSTGKTVRWAGTDLVKLTDRDRTSLEVLRRPSQLSIAEAAVENEEFSGLLNGVAGLDERSRQVARATP